MEEEVKLTKKEMEIIVAVFHNLTKQRQKEKREVYFIEYGSQDEDFRFHVVSSKLFELAKVGGCKKVELNRKQAGIYEAMFVYSKS